MDHLSAVYAEISPAQKANIWKEKLDLFINLFFTELSSEETVVLREMQGYLEAEQFVPGANASYLANSKFDEFELKLQVDFNWSSGKIYFWFHLPHTFEELPVSVVQNYRHFEMTGSFENAPVAMSNNDVSVILLHTKNNSPTGPGGFQPICQCRTDFACAVAGQGNCNDEEGVECDPSEDCCGTFRNRPCIGRCE